MSSKRITIVIGILFVLSFGYISYHDAVRTWHNLQQQKTQIDNLNKEYNNINQKLDESSDTRQNSQEEIQKLEQDKQQLEQERLKLQLELPAKVKAITAPIVHIVDAWSRT